MSNWSNESILIAFVAITGMAVLLQAIILLAISLAARKAARSLEEVTADFRDTVLPMVVTAKEILDRIAPKIEPVAADIGTVTSNLAEISQRLRAQTAEVQASSAELLEKLRHQSIRVDGMITSVLDAVDKAGSFVQHAIGMPARQLSGLLAALKAIVESLRNAEATPHASHSNGDKDMFV